MKNVIKKINILNKLTGISCPVFGISWNPDEAERDIAKRINVFLEAKRVLYSPYELETVFPVVESVTEIRNMITSEIPRMKEGSKLEECSRAMRNACNKFLSKCKDDEEFRKYANMQGNICNWIFLSAIGELRGIFGVMVGQIAKAYGIDVEEQLAEIIPD